MSDFRSELEKLGLILDLEQLAGNTRALEQKLTEGMAEWGAELAMLPAYLAPPPDDLAGQAIAVDAGGTHLRAARIRVGGQRTEVLGEPVTIPLPGAAGRPAVGAEQFFGAHRRLLEDLNGEAGLPLGYCFSYPITCQPDGDAVLNKWTKEVRVSGVQGQPVGRLLRECLAAASLAPQSIVVLNDTIATLIGGSFTPAVAAERCIGLIVGTGTNMGAYLPRDRMTKLTGPSWPHETMAVDFESGAFACPVLGPVDEQVDQDSAEPGKQRFEKAVSGAYLGRVFTTAARMLEWIDAGEQYDSQQVSELALDVFAGQLNVLARVLIERSADLVASALAATDELLPGDGSLSVCAEGSLFWQGPGYADRVQQTLEKILEQAGRPASCHIFSTPHANLVGSAAAALVRGG